MTLIRHRSFRIMAAVFLVLGAVGLADGTQATSAALPVAALLSAALLPALLARRSLVPARVRPQAEATR